MKNKFWLVGGMILLIASGFLVYWWREGDGDLIDPNGYSKFGVFKKNTPEVVGFLPTWMVGKTQDYSGKLDQLIFLGIEADEDGSLKWDSESKKINNENYLKMKQAVESNKGKNILGIKLFDSEVIDNLIASESARKRLISESRAIAQVAGFDGVNVDFEYMGDPMRVLQDDFIDFMAEYKKEVGGEISLDVFANTIIKGDPAQILKMINSIDKVIVMAYDFHQTSSDFVGPVAPIGSPTGERNITEVVAKIVEANLPKEKIILAYPLYGYQWRTKTEAYGSQVSEDWGRMVSYREAKDRLADGTYENFIDFKMNWDEVSMTPWVSFKNEETAVRSVRLKNSKGKYYWKQVTVPVTRIYQAYFENQNSIGAKIDLAKQAQVGGVGFWALGYEGEDQDVWSEILKIKN